MLDAEGELVESSLGSEPLQFIFGLGQLPTLVEQAIDGLSVGDRRSVDLSADQAFGRRDEAALLVVERGEIPASARPGDELEAEAADGSVVFLRVLEVDEECAWLDANHPLAGQDLTLELCVASARPARQRELDAAWARMEASGGAPDVPVAALLGRGARPAPGRS